MQTITKRFLKTQLRCPGGQGKGEFNDKGSHAAIQPLHSVLSRDLPSCGNGLTAFNVADDFTGDPRLARQRILGQPTVSHISCKRLGSLADVFGM